MGARLLPRNLPELFSYSLVLEREAARRYAELEHFLRAQGARALAEEFVKLGREEREQYEVIALGTSGRELPELAGWELGWYFGGASVSDSPAPRNTLEALAIALGFERRTQSFYNDVATNARAENAAAPRLFTARRTGPGVRPGVAPRVGLEPTTR